VIRRILLAALLLAAAAGPLAAAVGGVPIEEAGRPPLLATSWIAGAAAALFLAGATLRRRLRIPMQWRWGLVGLLQRPPRARSVRSDRFTVLRLLVAVPAFLAIRSIAALDPGTPAEALLVVPLAYFALRFVRRTSAAREFRIVRDGALVALVSLVLLGNPASVAGARIAALLLAALLPGLQGDRARRASRAPGPSVGLPGAAWAVPAVPAESGGLGHRVSHRGEQGRGSGDSPAVTAVRRVSIGDLSRLQLDPRPIAEVQVIRRGRIADAEDLGPLFRSGALEEFDGSTWESRDSRSLLLSDAGDGVRDGFDALPPRRLPAGEAVEQRIRFLTGGSDALFCLGMPTAVGGTGAKRGVLLAPRGEVRAAEAYGEEDAFTIRSVAVAGENAPVDLEPISGARRMHLLDIPPGHARTVAWARENFWRPDSPTGRRLLRRLDALLRRTCRYSLDIAPRGEAMPVEAFLFDARRGHCELFASAAAVMLRAVGVPSRVVIGFRGGRLDPATNAYTLRGSDAHAWVEAWVDGQGWLTLDATPSAEGRGPTRPGTEEPAAEAAGEGRTGVLDGLFGVDVAAQRRLLADAARRATAGIRDAFLGPDGEPRIPGVAVVVAALALLGVALLRARGRRTDPATPPVAAPPPPLPEAWTVLLRRLEAAGIRRGSAETGLELAARAAARGFGPEAALPRLADAYAAERFGGRAPSAGERAALVALAASVGPAPPSR